MSRFHASIVMCLSVCYLFVSQVSSPVAWRLAGSFCLVCLPAGTLLPQLLLATVGSEWRGGCRCLLSLTLLLWRHLLSRHRLLVIIFYSLDVKIVCDLLCQHLLVLELPEWVCLSLSLLLRASLLFKRVPLVLQLLQVCLKHWNQRVLRRHSHFFGAPI